MDNIFFYKKLNFKKMLHIQPLPFEYPVCGLTLNKGNPIISLASRILIELCP